MKAAVPVLAMLVLSLAPFSGVAQGQDTPELYLYVNDFVGVLTYDEVSTLDEICYELDAYNSDELAIVIVNSTQPMGIDTFASETFEANGIGKSDLDNGVMVLISTEEGLWRIEVGYGLEGLLNDAKVGQIGRENLEPYLASEDYYPGIFYTVSSIIDVLTSDPADGSGFNVPLFGWHIDYWKLGLAIVAFIAVAIITKGQIFLWIGSILTRGRFGGGSSGGGGAKGRF